MESNIGHNNLPISENRSDFNEKIPNGEPESIYYGVHIPSDTPTFESNIFSDKIEALKLVKKYKKARFKAFSFYHEAEQFALRGAEFPNNNISIITPKKQEQSIATPNPGEKCQYRGPKSQDLVKLRKGIECGDIKFVEKTVWENPRYLISSGDTPSILQEGFRYNALHVAAKSKNPDMCELILNTVGNVMFIELLYGDEDHQSAEDRAKILLDLYLNTPDKGLNETPLHFAVKFGALKVVEVLVSFPQCDKNVKNKYGKLPSQIICDRCDGNVDKLRSQIALVLEENYYVPVYRSEDNCIPAVVGEPFSPTSPPNFRNDPLQSRLEIHAYAGPLDKEGADKFRKIWKTPPRSVGRANRSTGGPFDDITTLKLRDPEKGLETVGRELASKYEVGWKEYWPFLGSFVDLSSRDGLEQLEKYLREKTETNNGSSGSKLINYDRKDTGGQVEKVIESPMTELCRAFESCSLAERNGTKSPSNEKISTEDYQFSDGDLNPFTCLERSCQVFAHRISIDILNLIKTDDHHGDILETQIKFLEQLILSYVEDGRFSNINFHAVHARLAALIVLQLRDLEADVLDVRRYVEKIQDVSTKTFDYFSSDDESVPQVVNSKKRTTSSNKQVVCVLGHVLNILKETDSVYKVCNTEEECRVVWEAADKCLCVWQSRNSRRVNSGKRNNHKTRMSLRSCYDNVSKKLTFAADEIDGVDNADISVIPEDDTSSDEEFYTPPSSPSLIRDSSDEEDFDETHLPETEVYLEGPEPTKMDRDVYNALRTAMDKLNPKDYPYIYKWHHAVSLHNEEERKTWCSPRVERGHSAFNFTSTPCRGSPLVRDECLSAPPVHASPKSWFRVTGANSPRASLHTFRNNVSFNL